MQDNPCRTFAPVLAALFGIMYGVMFLNVARLDHMYLSTTRLCMTLLMLMPNCIK